MAKILMIKNQICPFVPLIVSSADVKLKSHQSGIKGGSITFPDPLENGIFIVQGTNIAEVKDKKIDILEETFKDRLLWNNKTGLFTIRGLKNIIHLIKNLNVNYIFLFNSPLLSSPESVAAPAVEAVNVSAESCSFLCLVKKTEETTLLWYKDEEIINQSSSALSLPLTVHRHDVTSSYRCTVAPSAARGERSTDWEQRSRGAEGPVTHGVEFSPGGIEGVGVSRAETLCGGLWGEEFFEIEGGISMGALVGEKGDFVLNPE
uniref:Uncharacterized LOC110005905 n=1 Tax=Labrus bergylta TaxID=56723 RepID=A0A3Q3FM07_9LABR